MNLSGALPDTSQLDFPWRKATVLEDQFTWAVSLMMRESCRIMLSKETGSLLRYLLTGLNVSLLEALLS